MALAGARGSLSTDSDTDYWSFEGTTGQVVSFSTENPGSQPYTGLQYSITGPGGSYVGSYGSYDGRNQSRLTLTSSGTYTIRVGRYYNYAGEYRITLASASQPLELAADNGDTISAASPIKLTTFGSSRLGSIAGAISGPGDLDYYSLGTIDAGETVRLSLRRPAGSTLLPAVSLYDAANGYLVEDFGQVPFDDIAQIRIPYRGVFYAVVWGRNGTGGPREYYVLDVQVGPSGPATVPNLQVSAVVTPTATDLRSGGPVQFSYTVRNSGLLATQVPAWSDRAVLSKNSVAGDADDIPLGLFRHEGALAVNGSYTATINTTLPDGIDGPYYLIISADALNEVNEFLDERDNSRVSGSTFRVTRAPYPDLVVESITPSGGDANGLVTISWQTANRGTIAATGGFRERVTVTDKAGGYVVYDRTYEVSGDLATGAIRAGSDQFYLTYGRVYTVRVTTDSGGRLYEYNDTGHEAAEANNVRDLDFTAQQLADADLVVSVFTAPTSLLVGDPATAALSWTVENRGESTGSATRWIDRVVLSRDAVLGNGDDVTVVEVEHTGALATNGSYSVSRSVTLPGGLSGDYTLFVVADATGQVSEGGDESNNASAGRAIEVVPRAFADLVVDTISAPGAVRSGGSVTVGWTVSNRGIAATGAGPWIDRVVLSSDAVLDTGDLELARVSHGGSLAVGGSYPATATAVVPNGISGTYYVFVTTDAGEVLYEYRYEANNTLRAADPVVVSLTPPDLKVTSISNPTRGQAGQVAHMAWTVKNDGTGSADGSWDDRVYISANGSLSGATLLTTVRRTSSLAVGASYSASADVSLPDLADGSYTILVVTDASGEVYEDQFEGNNTTASSSVLVLGHPDLAAQVLSLPASAVAGTSITVRWSVRNTGTEVATAPWADRVYLSTDGTLDPQDILLVEVARASSLAQGASYEAQAAAVVPPIGQSGTYYLIIRADAGEKVAESGSEANNVALSSIRLAREPYADLTVADVVAPALTVGDPARVTVSWKVANQGTGAGSATGWTDVVMASTDDVAGNGDDVVLARFSHAGALAVGESYARSETFRLPPAFQFHGRLFVKADADNAVDEFDFEGNNAARSPGAFDVTPRPYADLVVRSVVPGAGASSGRALHVTWTVANQGIGLTDIPDWNDAVYLATSPDGSGAQYLGSFSHQGHLSVGAFYTREADVVLPNGISGTYYLMVATGGPYEFIYGNNNSTVSAAFSVQLTPPPDLTVVDITAPPEVVSGTKIDLTWQVRNVGPGAALGSWSDSVELRSTDGASVIPLGNFSYNSGLEAGKSYTRSEQFALPDNIQGLYRVQVRTNANNALYEHGATGNNLVADDATILVRLAPHPDLQVSSVSAPDRVQGGGTIAVEFTVRNQGTAMTSTPRWTDYVYMSIDDTISGDDILIGAFENGSALAPGDSYPTRAGSLVVPKRFRGDAYILVRTDGNDAVNEFPNEDNNLFVKPVYVQPLPPADLVIGAGDVVAPAQAFNGSSIDVRYTVRNLGANSTDQDAWTDTLWLMPDRKEPRARVQNPFKEGGILLGSYYHSGALAVGGSYQTTARVTLPETIFDENGVQVALSGQWYITPWADAYDVVLEDTFSNVLNPDDPTETDNNNYKARPITILVVPPPDLVVTSVSPTASAVGGDSFKVQWTVTNRGAGETIQDGWYDEVYLSDRPTLNAPGAKQWRLDNYPGILHNGRLGPDQSYAAEATFALTPEIAGLYVLVKTGVGAWEGPYTTNNTTSAGTSVVPLAPADLRVESITVPASNSSGEKATISWTVVNAGASAWEGTRYWYDAVYISPDPEFIPSRAIGLGSFYQGNAPGLPAGARYTRTVEVTLPRGIGGEYFIHIVTDPNGALSAGFPSNDNSRGYFTTNGYEDPSNNLKSVPIPVVYREPDLKVTSLTVPNTTPKSGETIRVGWTVSNIGTRATREDEWVDRVYLSLDPSLDFGDQLLGESLRSGAPLAIGGTYDRTLDVSLPDGIQGTFYILVFVDSNVTGPLPPADPSLRYEYYSGDFVRMARVQEFQDEGNNVTSSSLPITLTPPPDLKVSLVDVPAQVIAGQPFSLTYTVTNAGPGGTPARQSSWDDYIYLSRDAFLDLQADRYLGAVSHQGGLAAGDKYTITQLLRAPRDLTGPFYVFVLTDPPLYGNRGRVFELDKEGNNASPSPQPMIISVPPPSDLQVRTINLPDTVKSGEPITVSWTVGNEGRNPAEGSWTDAVYLSVDATWDIGDIPLGRVVHSGTLGRGESYTSTLNVALPPARPGSYRIIVRPDILNEVYEGPDEANNRTASPNVLRVTVDELQLGVPKPITLSTGQELLFQVTVDQGRTLRISLDGSAVGAANELFVRFGDVPTGIAYDASYEGPLAPDQIAVIPTTKPGVYYILVRGHSEPAPGTPATILAELVPLAITSITPDSGGDSRWVTTTIRGARFDPSAIVKLVRPGFAEYEPVQYQVIDSTRIIATFDLRDAPHGLYDVRVTNPGGESAVVPYRYLVETALEPEVRVGLGGPRTLAPGATGTYGVSLENLSNVDQPYIYFKFGVPELGVNPNLDLRYLNFFNNLRGSPDLGGLDNLPWASLESTVNTTAEDLAPGFAFDLYARGYVGMTFNVETYPGLAEKLKQDPDFLLKFADTPEEIAFQFYMLAAATPMTRAEFVAFQREEAEKLRLRALADPTASQALSVLAADATTWGDLYIAALEDAGLLRPEDQAPPIRQDPKVMSLVATLASGLLVGPAGDQIVTNGNLLNFWAQVRRWYGNDPSLVAPGAGDEPRIVPAPGSDAYDLKMSSATAFEAFNLYVPFGDITFERGIAKAPPPDFAQYFNLPGSTTRNVAMTGPEGQGPRQFVPVGQSLPYTVNFENPATAASAVGEVQIVQKLDSDLDPRSFRLGDLRLGDITVHIPSGRGIFQGEFDFTKSKGFILRVSAGLDVFSNTATWLLQAIDPDTGEVIQDPARGLLRPNDAAGLGSGYVGYTIEPLEATPTGTEIRSTARILFNNAPPQDTEEIVSTIDGQAPTTTLTVAPLTSGGSDLLVSWSSADDGGGSGVKHVTVYVSEDGGDYTIWLRQSTATSGVYAAKPGHNYRFLALATDLAGNRERPGAGVSAPDDGSTVNLGALPVAPETTTDEDLGPVASPSPSPSTNPLFLEAEQAIPSAGNASRPSEFATVLRPFVGESFATGIATSHAGIGPMAIVVLPDRSVIISGGAGRNQLFRLTAAGGAVGTPLATLDVPVFDLALDASGQLWASTGGGPLLKLDPATGAVLGRYGDAITQAVAVQPSTGRVYVSSSGGVEIFDPVSLTFSHFSDVRVGNLAFAPDGTLWGTTWPNRGSVVRFDHRGRAERMLAFDTPVDSIAFGQAGSRLDGLLFVSNNAGKQAGAGGDVVMVDLVTLRTVVVAKAGTRGDIIRTTPDGRVLISESHQVDVLSPALAPRVAATNPAPGGVVALPLGSLTVTFDRDMYDGPADDLTSVLNPANYALSGDVSGVIRIRGVAYDRTSRTVALSVEPLVPDRYSLKVVANVRSADGLSLAEPYEGRFTGISDFTSQVRVSLSNVRVDSRSGTVTYDVRVTNTSSYDLRGPLMLRLDGLQPADARLLGSRFDPSDGTFWLDLTSAATGGVLTAGQTTAVRPLTIAYPIGSKLTFRPALLALPYPNAAPVFDSLPITTATAGTAYRYQPQAHDPDGVSLGYLLVKGPAGMTVDAKTGLVFWAPDASAPALAQVILHVYDARGGRGSQEFAISVAGVNAPPTLGAIGPIVQATEGQPLALPLQVADPEGDTLLSWAENLPPGATYDAAARTLNWTPGFDAAGTYEDVRLVVSDGYHRVLRTFTILVAPANQAPTLVRPADRVVREGDPIRINLRAQDPEGSALTFFSDLLPGGATIDPATGLFEWTPLFIQHGEYDIPISVSDGVNTTTRTMHLTVLNVNAPPEFDDLSRWEVQEGQVLHFRAFAFDPDNPTFVLQTRMANGELTPLEETAASVTYAVEGLPAGANFDPVSATLTWVPGYDQAGTYTITFTATDDGDGTGIPATATATARITVKNTNRPPVLTPIDNLSVDRGASVSLVVQAVDPDGDPIRLSATGLPGFPIPGFATFVDNGNGTGRFVFAPRPGDRGNHTITIVAADDGDKDGPWAVSTSETSFVVTVVSPNEPPSLAFIGDSVAIVGRTLHLPISAFDFDEEPLTFTATGLPAGASLVPSSTYGQAEIVWTPSAATSSTVTVRVADGGNGDISRGLFAERTFRLVARAANAAPVLAPVGSKSVTEGQLLGFTLAATDPDGDTPSYRVDTLPPGASFDPASGRFSWTPNLFQAGSYSLVFSATDGNLSDSESVTITVANKNQSPTIVPLAPQSGREGVTLQFTLATGDLDGDLLLNSLVSPLPAGARFDARTGQFTWTPGYEQAGTYTLTFRTVDPEGLTATADVILKIENANRSPSLQVSSHQVALGEPLTFTLRGSDPDLGTTLVYSAVGLPDGATIDPATGRFSWRPGPGQAGDAVVQFSVSDGEATAMVPVVLRAAIVPEPPAVSIELTPSFPVVPGQKVLVHAIAAGLAEIAGLTLSIDGQSVTLDAQGRAQIVAGAPGRRVVEALATDIDGLVGRTTAVLKVRDPADEQAPTVALASSLAGSRLTAAVDVIGTIADTNLDTWTLELAPLGSDAYVRLASGSSPVANGLLARLDPATLIDGSYRLRLTATDISGRTSRAEVQVEARSATKPARYERRETDLTVSLDGVTVELARAYDSFASGQPGSFGAGWRMTLSEYEISTSVPPTGRESLGVYEPFRTGSRVYLTLPDGRRLGFTFTPVKLQVAGLTYYRPAFSADAGNPYTLEGPEARLTLAGDRYFDVLTARPYNPASPEFTGFAYTLVGLDRSVIRLSASGEVLEQVTPDDRKLIVRDTGIIGPAGSTIQFLRDASGRITTILAPDGTRLNYEYDSAGRLVSARNVQSGQASRYGYDAAGRLTLAVTPTVATSQVVVYGPTSAQPLTLAGNLGGSGQYLAAPTAGNLAAGRTDRYAFALRPSERLATASGRVLLSVEIKTATGSSFRPATPSIAGLTPLVVRTTVGGAYALFLADRDGLFELDIAGADTSSSGGYTLALSVVGDVDGNRKVDGVDSQLLQAAFGKSAGQPGYVLSADTDRDGVITAADVQNLASNLGFAANSPPVVTPTTILTHVGLAVEYTLGTLVSDLEDDPVYFRIISSSNGTARLSPDGRTLVYAPIPGFGGPGKVSILADDGYAMSAVTEVTINVSSAPLIRLDFAQRAPVIVLGSRIQMELVGDFADQQDVRLAPAYANLSIRNSGIATVGLDAVVTGVGLGGTALVASAGGLVAATGVQVVTSDEWLLGDFGSALSLYPGGVSLAVDGTRALRVYDDPELDLSSTSSGTEYFVSQPAVATVDANGVITAHQFGEARIIAINSGREGSLPIRVIAPVDGPLIVGPEGAIVRGPDGSTVQIAPNELPEGTAVSVSPVSEAQLPAGYSVPAGMAYLAAVNLDLGGREVNTPLQLSVPVAPGTPAGTRVYFFAQGTVPDEAGVEKPIWLQTEVGVVGSDGFARTTSFPFPGLLGGGIYLLAVGVVAFELVLIDIGNDLASGTAIVAPQYVDTAPLLGIPFGWIPGYFTGALFMRPGNAQSVKVVQPSVAGPPRIDTLTFDVGSGTNRVVARVQPNFAGATGRTLESPAITETSLEFESDDTPVLTIRGEGFASTTTARTEVVFVLGQSDVESRTASGQIDLLSLPRDVIVTDFISISATEIRLRVPRTVPLGLASIFVARRPVSTPYPAVTPSTPVRTATNLATFRSVPRRNATDLSLEATYLRSNQIQVPLADDRLLGFVVNSSGPSVYVFDTGDSGTSRTPVFLQEIEIVGPAGDRPFIRDVATTADGTRAYVTSRDHGVTVIDALTLRQIDADPALTNANPARQPTADVDWIPVNGHVRGIAIDPADRFAFLADENVGMVYVLDIRPWSQFFHQIILSIPISNAPNGLEGVTVAPDGDTIYVTVPGRATAQLYGTGNPGKVVSIDIRNPDPSYWRVGSAKGTGGEYPAGVIVAPGNRNDPDRLLVANMIGDSGGLATFGGGGLVNIGMSLGQSDDSYDVDNVRDVAFLSSSISRRSVDFAFVTGYNIPGNADQPSHFHGYRYQSRYAAGSNIGIVRDPFGTGKLVAGTIPIPLGWSQGISLTPDGRYLYVSYVYEGQLRIYDVDRMLDVIEGNSQDTLDRRAVDDLDSSIVQVIAIPGLLRDIAIQSPRLTVTATGLQGESIPIDILNQLRNQLGQSNAQGLQLTLTSFVGGQVALTADVWANATQNNAMKNGVTALSLINQATQSQILQATTDTPYNPPAFDPPTGPPQFPELAGHQDLVTLGTSFATSGAFFFLPDLYATGSFAIPVTNAASTASGQFSFRDQSGSLRIGRIQVRVNPSPEIKPFSFDTAGLNFTYQNEEFRTIPYLVFDGRTADIAGRSGITVSIGYDAGQQSAQTILKEFTAAGVPLSTAIVYANAYNQIRNTGRDYFWRHEGEFNHLTTRQAEKLYRIVYERHVDLARSTYNGAGLTGAPSWENLNGTIRDILVDMRYRGDLTRGELQGIFRTSLVNNSLQQFRAALALSTMSQREEHRHDARLAFVDQALGSPLLAFGEPPSAALGELLTPEVLLPVAAEALARWLGASPGLANLRGDIHFVVSELPRGVLGLAHATATAGNLVIEVDDNAAGFGWFIDPTPGNNSEFESTGAPGELRAATGSPAYGQIDLLTVLSHELGHVLGLKDLDAEQHPHEVMTESLRSGERRLPGANGTGLTSSTTAEASGVFVVSNGYVALATGGNDDSMVVDARAIEFEAGAVVTMKMVAAHVGDQVGPTRVSTVRRDDRSWGATSVIDRTPVYRPLSLDPISLRVTVSTSPAGAGPDPDAVAGSPAWDLPEDSGRLVADSSLDDLARVLAADSTAGAGGVRDNATPSPSPKTVRLARRQRLAKAGPASERPRLPLSRLFRHPSNPGQSRPGRLLD
ncbi:CARDB domain-containing protein [Aquisphaera insulae]|uniref:CARDB domain-containing protein n=1 Tax=Aquisphaera insulae TaxID=2712864 RepID=UPI00196BA8C2|nr:CARDB domain-containing protein [Aquisphaera insulae]